MLLKLLNMGKALDTPKLKHPPNMLVNMYIKELTYFFYH